MQIFASEYRNYVPVARLPFSHSNNAAASAIPPKVNAVRHVSGAGEAIAALTSYSGNETGSGIERDVSDTEDKRSHTTQQRGKACLSTHECRDRQCRKWKEQDLRIVHKEPWLYIERQQIFWRMWMKEFDYCQNQWRSDAERDLPSFRLFLH
jgi:hypothetical protein